MSESGELVQHHVLYCVRKEQGVGEYGTLVLMDTRRENVDPHRPFWFDRTPQGAPLAVDVPLAFFDRVEVGDQFGVSLRFFGKPD